MRITPFLALLLLGAGATAAPVQVSEGALSLPTYVEGEPDPNPRFDLFVTSNFFYPYPARTNFTSQAVDHAWRDLHLENEFLRCTFLPDLGGHLYTCIVRTTPPFGGILRLTPTGCWTSPPTTSIWTGIRMRSPP